MQVDYVGAAVGTAFGELLALVKDVSKTVAMFRPLLEKLEYTLDFIEPMVKDIGEFSKKLHRTEEDLTRIKDLMNRGKDLVSKCSKVKKYNCFKKYFYSKKLSDLDGSIMREFPISLSIMHARDGREILYEVKILSEDVHRGLFGKSSGGVELGAGIKLGALGSFSVPEAPDFVVGLGMEESLKKLKKQLLERGASKTVVTAPGGCGKTTLVKKLCHDDDIKGKFSRDKFSNIFFVPVSKSPNLMDIVQKMFLHKGWQPPQIETSDAAAQALRVFLKEVGEHPVLLVLDDVWPGSKWILEKFVVKDIPDYKIVVTSRYEFPDFAPVHRLKPLTHGEAMELFRRCAGIEDKREGTPDKDDVEKMVRQCKGLPLALTVIAKSLRGRDSSYWKRRLLDSSEGLSILDSNTEVLDCLRKSLDDLEGDPVKDRFMDLGSFPEHCKIPATSLIDMWVEMYKLDFNGVKAVNDLHELASRSLADLAVTGGDSNEDEYCYSSEYARQHDLLRELAIRECNSGEVKERKRLLLELRGNAFPDWCNDQQQQPLSARLVSITTDETFTSSWPNLELPEAQVLVLNFQTKSYALPAFIEKLNKLKALIVTNHSFPSAKVNNFHVVASLSNLKRIRLERVKVTLRSMANLHFNNLQKLSFFMCSIDPASTSNGAQVFEVMPNLLELEIDYCIDLVALPNYIFGCVRLKKLSITNCHNFSTLPEQVGKLADLEVLRLNSCTNLVQLPTTIGSLKKLTFLNISDCLNLTMLPEETGQLVNLKKLNMKGCRLSELPPSFVKLQNLKKLFCDVDKASKWESLKYSLAFLDIQASEEDANLDWLRD